MRVLIDTNVLVSAVLFPGGVTRQALACAVESDTDAIVCDYTISELHDVFERKFSDQVKLLPRFMAYLSSGVTIVATPESPGLNEPTLRDPKDQPILSAARAFEVDLILTGDKDLLEAGLNRPRTVSPGVFLADEMGGRNHDVSAHDPK